MRCPTNRRAFRPNSNAKCGCHARRNWSPPIRPRTTPRAARAGLAEHHPTCAEDGYDTAGYRSAGMGEPIHGRGEVAERGNSSPRCAPAVCGGICECQETPAPATTFTMPMCQPFQPWPRPPNAVGEPRGLPRRLHPLVGREGAPVTKAPEAWHPTFALPYSGGNCGIGREQVGPASSSVWVYRLACARWIGYAELPSPNSTT